MGKVDELQERFAATVFGVTRELLRLERQCDHAICAVRDWRPSDWGASHDGIVICTNCRAEWHSPHLHGNHKFTGVMLVPYSQWARPGKDIFSLRVSGDRRGFIHFRHPSIVVSLPRRKSGRARKDTQP